MRGIYGAHARKYAALGWPTFPLAVGKKVPMAGSTGYKSASADTRIVRMRAAEHPSANIGIATGKVSGLIVIDIDPRNGGDRTLARLVSRGRSLTDTVEAITCQNGRHLYYACDADLQLGKRTLGPGIDVKGDGGYVVAPPSVWSKNGQRYRWLRSPWRAVIAPLPAWISESLRRRSTPKLSRPRSPTPRQFTAYRRQALAELGVLTAHMAQLADGRHQAPFRLACRIGKYQRHGLLTAPEIEQAFLRACACNGALAKYSSADLLGQISNGLRRAASDALPPLASRRSGQGRTTRRTG
jgi:hypothetical protein